MEEVKYVKINVDQVEDIPQSRSRMIERYIIVFSVNSTISYILLLSKEVS